MLAGVALLASCRSGLPTYAVPESEPGVYDALDPLAALRLDEALELSAGGSLEAAREILERLRTWQPRNVVIGRWLQEVELGLAERDAGSAAPDPAPPNGREELRRRYREAAEAEPTPTALVLAARLEDDPPSALHLLDRALVLDPACAWASYGKAHVLAASGRLGDAREALEDALATDPAHLPALRLHAWMLARSGRRQEGIAVLEAWLARAEQDRTYDWRSRDEARLDLGLMLLAEGRAEAAGEQLRALRPGSVDEVRRLAAQAAIELALGETPAARETTRAAQRADPMALLPVVQEALLLEYWLERPAEAEKAWKRVAELAGASEELGALVQRMRAQVHQGRIARRALEAGAPGARP